MIETDRVLVAERPVSLRFERFAVPPETVAPSAPASVTPEARGELASTISAWEEDGPVVTRLPLAS